MAVTTEVMVFWNVTPCSLVHTKGVADVGNVELNVILFQRLNVFDEILFCSRGGNCWCYRS